jgi:hypothetical protein
MSGKTRLEVKSSIGSVESNITAEYFKKTHYLSF